MKVLLFYWPSKIRLQDSFSPYHLVNPFGVILLRNRYDKQNSVTSQDTLSAQCRDYYVTAKSYFVLHFCYFLFVQNLCKRNKTKPQGDNIRNVNVPHNNNSCLYKIEQSNQISVTNHVSLGSIIYQCIYGFIPV
jgi:hypothetical protein